MRPTRSAYYSNSSLAIVTVTSTCKPKLTWKNENLIFGERVSRAKSASLHIFKVKHLKAVKTKKKCTEEKFLDDYVKSEKNIESSTALENES